MSQTNDTETRRTFLKFVAAGAVALPIAGSLLRSGSALAATAPELKESDPTAIALGYKKDTTQVDAAKYPKHTPEQDCAKCRYFSGKAGEEIGPCSIFGGKGVHKNGWCSAYAAK